MKGKIDIILFNPPYVVTDAEELAKAQQDKGIAATWAGGKDGVEILIKLLAQVADYMSP